MIQYEFALMDLERHQFHVRMRVHCAERVSRILRMPAWIPGSYMIRDFARNVCAITATDADGPVVLNKLDKQTWETAPVSGELLVNYVVYAFDLSVRSAYLDRSRAYFNGTSVFLHVDGMLDAPWSLTLERSLVSENPEWRVATTLPGAELDEWGFGIYRGRGYRELIDHPVEIGTWDHVTFDVQETPHDFVVSDAPGFDHSRLAHDLGKICNEHAAMFSELPVTRYLFLALATADGYGGLEHANSCSLMCKRADLPRADMDAPEKNYRQFLGLCSHEYFHLWNVKRIMPASFMGAALREETHTELLWAFEGITSYYDDLALARSGVVTPGSYLELLAATVSRVLRTAGRLRQSVAESSFDAWTKFYKQDENAPNAIVSYYAKGALVAFGLDVIIRERSGDRFSLDDLMRVLWSRYGKTGVGIAERGIENEVASLVGSSCDDFFDRFVYGVDELPLGEWCSAMGLGFRMRRAKGPDDMGGSNEDAPAVAPTFTIGARFESLDVGIKLTQVFEGGAAQRAGMSPGDVVVAIGLERVSGANLTELLGRATAETVPVHFFRRDMLTAADLPIVQSAEDTCDLWLLAQESLSGPVAGRRASWLRSAVSDGLH